MGRYAAKAALDLAAVTLRDNPQRNAAKRGLADRVTPGFTNRYVNESQRGTRRALMRRKSERAVHPGPPAAHARHDDEPG